MGVRGELYSTKVHSEKRTYFFNVKENRMGDAFLNIVESSRKEVDGEFERHQIMVFEEDIENFYRELQKAVSVMVKKRQVDRPRSTQSGGTPDHGAKPSSERGTSPKTMRNDSENSGTTSSQETVSKTGKPRTGKTIRVTKSKKQDGSESTSVKKSVRVRKPADPS